MDIHTRVAGIPCIARVMDCRYTRPNYASWASPEDYFGGWVIEWEICDSRGRPAPWLERKATDADRERIEAELIEQLQGAEP